MESGIVIDQCLHGYHDGHRLLKSSKVLTNKEKRVLQELSDLSGYSNSTFKPYISGYPIEGSSFYVLAKTWPALKMSRPGCVWTHSLLINNAIIGQIRDLSHFSNLFSCPEVLESINDFSIPLKFDFSNNREYDQSLNRFKQLKDFLPITYYLYSYSDKNIFLVKNNAGITYGEELLLKIWSFQWPKLRRKFSFCSNSIKSREIEGKTFDLQVTNKRLRIANSEYVEHTNLNERNYDQWIQELGNCDFDQLRNFLFKYGADVEGLRQDFVPLVKSFGLFRKMEKLKYELPSINYFLNESFKASYGNKLKRDLLNKLFQLNPTMKYYYLQDSLNMGNGIGIFSGNESLEILKEGAEQKFIGKQELATVFDKLISSYTIDIEANVNLISHLPTSIWVKKKFVDKEFIRKALVFNKSVIRDKIIWSSKNANLWFRCCLEERLINKRNLKSVLNSMISARYYNGIIELFNIDSKIVITQYLNNYSEIEGKFCKKFDNIILNYPNELTASLIEQKSVADNHLLVLKVIERIESPKLNSTLILKTAEQLLQSDYVNYISFCLNVLKISMSNKINGSDIITSYVFEVAYNHFASIHNDEANWNELQKALPNVKYTKPDIGLISKMLGVFKDVVPDWDKCETLVRSLLECYVIYEWEVECLFYTMSEPVFGRFVAHGLKSWKGRQFIDEVFKRSKNHPNYHKTLLIHNNSTLIYPSH